MPIIRGTRVVGGGRDSEGHRTYKAKYRIEATLADGPRTVLNTPGLPVPGSEWVFAAEVDMWATCLADATVTMVQENEAGVFWDIELTFSTKPPGSDGGGGKSAQQRCQDSQIEDPLLEPPKVNGSSIKYTEEASFDRVGRPILSSSFEPFHGPPVEFDSNRDQISIEMNYPTLGAEVWGPMRDTVNMYPMWGLPARCIKLSGVTWEKKTYGRCYYYYSRTYQFETWVKKDPQTGALISGFDRQLLDHGTKALNGDWDEVTGNWVLKNINGAPPDPTNPAHFKRLLDRSGNPMKVPLDGAGKPVTVKTGGLLTNISQSAPVTYSTGTPHGMANGDIVAVVGINTDGDNAARPGANGVFVVAGATSTTFQGVGSNNNGGGTGQGGYWYKVNNTAGKINVQRYGESNFFDLGVPLVL